ncbi:MAG: Crp/Fnr family transcriptional regulator, partial [Flavobacterium psychrophilum]
MYKQLTDYINSQIEVSESELSIILSYFKPMKLKKYDLAVNDGQTIHRIFFVDKGCLRIYFINKSGEEATRYFAFENQFATSLVSFITGEPSEEFIQAAEYSELLYIT